MPRKKSAARKAKELELKQQQIEKQNTDSSEEPEIGKEISIEKLQKEDSAADESESEAEDSESEDEDEFGELLDKETDLQISKVLTALKNDDKSFFLNKDAKFFKSPEEAVADLETRQKKSEKPVFLKDYHRMNLLKNGGKDVEDDADFVDEDKPKTYVEIQTDERNKLLDQINDVFNEEDEEYKEDEDFLKKKTSNKVEQDEPISNLPDPNLDEEKFLSSFIEQSAWIPKSKKDFESMDIGTDDKDEIKREQKFDEAAENFERIYNHRYEDDTSADIISYARNQATIRRSNMNSRKKQRLKKQEKKKEEKLQHNEKIKKKKQEKINKVIDRLEEIKQAICGDNAGTENAVDLEVVSKVFGDSLLKDDFDNDEWDSKMSQIFNENFYTDESKPVFTEDDEIMNEFYEEKKEEENKHKYNDNEEDNDEAEQPTKKKSKHHKLAEKKLKKREKQTLKEQAEKIVQSNIFKIEEEVEKDEEKERNHSGELRFKYKQVEPETFGLTQREILLASDNDLNDYISLKKLAPYRDPDLVQKDKRKVSKKKRLREWRKKVFGNEEGLK